MYANGAVEGRRNLKLNREPSFSRYCPDCLRVVKDLKSKGATWELPLTLAANGRLGRDLS